jgi:hypothetical protein
MADFRDLDLSKVELQPIDGNPSTGFNLTVLVSRGEDRFDARKFELPTAQGLLFRALIAAHREQAAEIAELRSRLEGKKPAAKGRAAA